MGKHKMHFLLKTPVAESLATGNQLGGGVAASRQQQLSTKGVGS